MCFFTLWGLNDRIPVLFLTHKLANRCMLSRTNKGEVLCSAPPIGWFNWLIVNCPQGSKYKNTHSHEHQQSEKEEEKESLINFVLNGCTWENTVTTKPPAFSLQQLLRQCSLDSLEEEMLGKFFHNVVILSRVFLFFSSVFYVRLVGVIFLPIMVFRANSPRYKRLLENIVGVFICLDDLQTFSQPQN